MILLTKAARTVKPKRREEYISTYHKIKLEVSLQILCLKLISEFFSHGKVGTMTLPESHNINSPNRAVIKKALKK